MKKEFKTLRNGILGFVFGAIFCVTIEVAAETLIGSEGVSYSNSKTAKTTVDGALDELFSAVDINEKIANIEQSISTLQVQCEQNLSLDEAYPVGSIYITESNKNPGDIIGGTWQRYGVGRTLVSTDGTSGQTGGSATVTLSTNNLPKHSHSIPALSGTAASTGSGYKIGHTYSTRDSLSTGSGYSITYGSSPRTTTTAGAHTHWLNNAVNILNAAGIGPALTDGGSSAYSRYATITMESNGAHTHDVADYYATSISGVAAHIHKYNDYYANSISGVESHKHSVTTVANTTGETGSGASFSVQDPYITVYMWKRTA